MYAKIFINYRRGDAPTSTERIYERLSREVGSASLFRDIHDIPAGADFTRVLEAAIEEKAAHVEEIHEQHERREKRRNEGYGLWGKFKK